MSQFELSIAGATLVLKDKYPPQLSTRRIYNASHFHDDRYRHEIANHYRDYKLRPRIRRRRRNPFLRYRQQNFENDVTNEFRDVLPLAVQDFPRFAERVFTPRGRRTLCESRPPDETYNATVRRIRAANSCKELKELVQRQLSYAAHKQREPRSSSRRRSRRKSSAGRTSRSCCYDSSTSDNVGQQKTKCDVVGKPEKWYDNLVQQSNKQPPQQIRQQQQQQLRQRRRRSLGNLESVATYRQGQSVKGGWQKPHTKRATDKANNNNNKDKFAYYLHLATEHYEEGYLANIKYLESIGERNAIIRRRRSVNSKRHQNNVNTTATSAVRNDADDGDGNGDATSRNEATTASANSRTESVRSNASVSSTTTSTDCQTPTPRVVVETAAGFRLATLLKRIGRRRTFRVGNSTAAEAQDTTSNNNTSDWAIRVNITPAIASIKSEAGLAIIRHSYSGAAEAPKATSAQSACIMNNYLNTNLQQTNTLSAKIHKAANNNSANANPRTQFHQLINQLTQLEISDIDLSLPKITLTDCSTNHRAATADSTEQRQSKCSTAGEEDLRKQRASAFILKQSKFNTSLDLSNEANYHSEARPP